MLLTIIAAASENNVIGNQGKIPWSLPKDFARLKERTMGNPIIMGRRTYDSIGRPLPGRINIVVTRGKKDIDGCIVVHSLEDAIDYCKREHAKEAFIFGGGEIYAQAMPKADRIDLTRVHMRTDGDAYFPAIDARWWQEVSREDHPADERHSAAFSFIRYERAS
jgi:dihydrofolate reductase